MWLLSVICGGVAGFFLYPHVYPCNSNVGSVVVSVTDSTAPAKDTGIVDINTQPKLKEIHKYSTGASRNNGTLSVDFRKTKVVEYGILAGKQNYSYTSNSNKDNGLAYDTVSNNDFSYTSSCLDTNIFTVDTQAVDNFKARATATVTNNQLIWLLIEYQNFKPEKWKVLSKTVTVEKKQSLVKVYSGIYAGVAIANKTVASYHGGIGLDAIISDRHLIGLQGGLNSSLQMEFGVRFSEKLRLKK